MNSPADDDEIPQPPCHGLTELFYSDQRADQAEAAAICRRCPWRRPCLAAAFTRTEQHGVWGGLTAAERRRALDPDQLHRMVRTGARLRSSRKPA